MSAGQVVKIKLLGLHGFSTSGTMMQDQLTLANWIPTLKEHNVNLECHCIDAPHRYTGEVEHTVKLLSQTGPYYQWWDAQKTGCIGMNYQGKEQSFQRIAQALKNNGPFDGIIGFSQGACMAHLVAALQEQDILFRDCPQLKFAIIISGFPTRDSDLSSKAYKNKINIPSMHIYGAQDFISFGSKFLTGKFNPQSSETIQHSGGHVIPRLEKNQAKQIATFMLKNKTKTSSHL